MSSFTASKTPSFKTLSRLHPSHSLVTVQAAKRFTHSLLYSESSLCHAILINTVSGMWRFLAFREELQH
ncbi:BgTH12-05232 [Blumeria graminis f. sp. triticale]|uniref:Bgt-20876 n=3 Tax=Blumeria graminis TaxID=34373 RepID=A0A381LG60_BLUGR|nr:BgTH12-05232 [Blumeria graminis f. sp. triticale]VDB88071.1 Bgt-20876 [Blumeria graminis f. sp. tritici]